MAFPRYTSVTQAYSNNHNLPPHDAVLLVGGTAADSAIYTFSNEAVRGGNGKVMVPQPNNTYGVTGPTLTITASAAGDDQMLPIQIKGTGAIDGHEVFLLKQ